jgi:cytochrome c
MNPRPTITTKLLTTVFCCVLIGICNAQNTLTKQEEKDGWKLLFDGKTLKGWRNFKSKTIGEAWSVTDGAIHLNKTQKEGFQVKGGGDIVTENEFENFELSIEWKIAPCGNSGIIFNVVEAPEYQYVWQTGPEMQVLDNACHPDAKIEKHRAGNLYDLIASSTESVKPANEWNVAKIVSNKGHLELWLNGVKQVETTMFTPEWEAMIKGSKFKDMPGFGKSKKGRISLQDHGDLVWFRNIKIKELK